MEEDLEMEEVREPRPRRMVVWVVVTSVVERRRASSVLSWVGVVGEVVGEVAWRRLEEVRGWVEVRRMCFEVVGGRSSLV